MAFHAGRRYWKFAFIVTVLGPVLAGCETAGFGAAGGGEASVATEGRAADVAGDAAQGEKRISWGL